MDNNCCNDQTITQLADFLRVISEENRLRIVCYLQKKGERCVCEIQKFLNLPQNLTSHHLKVLRDFGLLKSRKDGLKVFYSLNRDDLVKYQDDLDRTINKRGDK